MTYRDIILTFDTLRPNVIDEMTKFGWMRCLESEIFAEKEKVDVCDEVEMPEALACYVYTLICNYLLLVGDVGEYSRVEGVYSTLKAKCAAYYIARHRPVKARMKVDKA